MKSSAINTTERSFVILRVVLIYVILLLCAFIPVYYLLDLPEKWNEGTSIKGPQVNKENTKFERYMVKVDSLQKYLDKNDFGPNYSYWQQKLTEFNKDSLQTNFLYKPMYLKVADLYEALRQFKAYAEYKSKYDDLKADDDKLQKSYDQTVIDLNECKAKIPKSP
jgi:hypothetical protein